MRQELAEILNDPQAVVAVEWADQIEDVLPDDRLSVAIKVKGEEERQFIFRYPDNLNYLFPNT